MASSTSSTARSGRRGNKELNYEGMPRFCNCRIDGCRVKAPRWTSWTDENPGRRFYACPNFEIGSCGYFQWHDEPTYFRMRDLINVLKRENNMLLEENQRMKLMGGRLRNGVQEASDFDAEITELWCELNKLKKLKNSESESLKKKIVITYCVILISWFMFSVYILL